MVSAMKVSEIYNQGVDILQAANCESPAFDVTCLLEDLGGIGRGKVIGHMDDELTDTAYERVFSAIRKRANGEPLQYLLGTWDFLNLTLRVGEGVLIPRPDTEILCETAADVLQRTGAVQPRVLDLCAAPGGKSVSPSNVIR